MCEGGIFERGADLSRSFKLFLQSFWLCLANNHTHTHMCVHARTQEGETDEADSSEDAKYTPAAEACSQICLP